MAYNGRASLFSLLSFLFFPFSIFFLLYPEEHCEAGVKPLSFIGGPGKIVAINQYCYYMQVTNSTHRTLRACSQAGIYSLHVHQSLPALR